MQMYSQEKHSKQEDKSIIIRTFALIKPDVYTQIGKIYSMLEKTGLFITKCRMAKLKIS